MYVIVYFDWMSFGYQIQIDTVQTENGVSVFVWLGGCENWFVDIFLRNIEQFVRKIRTRMWKRWILMLVLGSYVWEYFLVLFLFWIRKRCKITFFCFCLANLNGIYVDFVQSISVVSCFMKLIENKLKQMKWKKKLLHTISFAYIMKTLVICW